MVERGAARFSLDATQQRAAQGELFVLEPEAVHTGMAAVPEGWAYKVLYIEPRLLHDWDERDAGPPRAARWVVFRDPALRGALDACPRRARRGARGRTGRRGGGAARRRRAAAAPAAWPVPPRSRARRTRRRAPGPRSTCTSAGTSGSRWPSSPTVAGLSRFELVRRFRAQNGITPHAFQIDLRVEHARRLLAAGVAPAEVAAECGFADQPHLSRVFKRAVGRDPGPLRPRLLSARTFKTTPGPARPFRPWAWVSSTPRSRSWCGTISPPGSA